MCRILNEIRYWSVPLNWCCNIRLSGTVRISNVGTVGTGPCGVPGYERCSPENERWPLGLVEVLVDELLEVENRSHLRCMSPKNKIHNVLITDYTLKFICL